MSRAIKQFATTVLDAVRMEMYGVDEIVRMSLVALYTGGHILLEGNPGLGKTELVKTLGKVLRLPFGRIQFTPDLMPSDITGTLMPDPNDRQRLAFKPGPLFTSLLLADEINRATPKTQSAMLEAMAERQVTVIGEKKQLPAPFTVLATQNPIDHEGTYHLPEAQSDRFMFKVLMPVPGGGTLRKILRKQAGTVSEKTGENPAGESPEQSLLPKNHEDSRTKYEALRARIEKVEPLPSLETHVLNMFLASNGRFGELEGLDRKQVETLKILGGELLTYGLGPRASIAMMLGAKAWSLLFLNDAEYAEGAGLARVVLPILRHRLKLEFDWRDRFRARFDLPENLESGFRERLMEQFCLAAAPKQHEYYRTFQVPLEESVRRDLGARGLGRGPH